MKRITVVVFVFVGVVVLGFLIAAKSFFSEQPSSVAMVTKDVSTKTAMTTLDVSVKPSLSSKNLEDEVDKAGHHLDFISADRGSDPVEDNDVVDETYGDDPFVDEYVADNEVVRSDEIYSHYEMEQSEVPNYRYPTRTPTPYTKQIVDALVTPIQVEDEPLTQEQVDQWDADLQELLAQGEAAIPAIGEYLNTFENTVFRPDEAWALGYPSSRVALLDTLQQIGGDEAIGLSLQMLGATTEPTEVAFLAKVLAEQVTNEEAREAAVDAALEVLDLAKQGEIKAEEDLAVDVGPLFEVLYTYGNDEVVADLEEVTGEWRYYAAIALANLPDGAGIPALVDMANGNKQVPSTVRSQALVMLAQVSTQSQEARNTLVEAARSNQIGESSWHYIGESLSGVTYRLETDEMLDEEGVENTSRNMKFHHIKRSNQNFITDSGAVNWSEEEIDWRLALVDELLSVNSSPKAVEVLRKSQNELHQRFEQLNLASISPDN